MVFLVALYVCCSAMGLVLIKLGTRQSFSAGMTNGIFRLEFGGLLLAGLALYVISFILSIVVMSKMNITFFYPLSAGLIYALVCLLGVFLLKEKVETTQYVGMLFILLGIVVISIKRA